MDDGHWWPGAGGSIDNYSSPYLLPRIERLEFLDEQELLVQLLQHYTLSCGYTDRAHIGKPPQHS